MVLEFSYDEKYLKTHTPDSLKNEVFEFYFGGFKEFKGKSVVLLRRHKKDAATEQTNQVQILYNGRRKPLDEPFKMNVVGVMIDDYLNRELWNVIIAISRVKIDGNPVEAIIPGGDFTYEELYKLYEVKNGLSDFGEFQIDSEAEQLFKPFMSSLYIRLLNTMHMSRDTAYRTDRGFYVSSGEKTGLQDEGAYCELVRFNGIFSGGQQFWLCRYPVGRWKENKVNFLERVRSISPNARGSRLNVSMIFDKKYIVPDDSYEYRLFKIANK